MISKKKSFSFYDFVFPSPLNKENWMEGKTQIQTKIENVYFLPIDGIARNEAKVWRSRLADGTGVRESKQIVFLKT